MSFISNLFLAFKKVVLENSTNTALFYPHLGIKISYQELFDLSEKIARNLFDRGISEGNTVIVLHDKSPNAFGLMLACIRLGTTYVMIDPDGPYERFQKINSFCKPVAIINTFQSSTLLKQHKFMYPDINTIDIGELINSSHKNICLPDEKCITGSTPAYVMFTSGSTGFPKGAAISHANLLWFTNWAREEFNISSLDTLSNLNPMYFDNSVFDFYASIFNGATLVPLNKFEVQNPSQAISILEASACTIWFSVPSLLIYYMRLKAIDGSQLKNLRKIIFGGEGFPLPKLKTLFNMFSTKADLINVYGPTECTCICSAHKVSECDFNTNHNFAPLGKLAQNFSGQLIHYTDSNDDNNFGELFLLGPQVGLGYFNDLERTNKSFIQNPTNSSYREIGYLTGDIVQKDPDGMLHFKGRRDNQIKHLGFRIELEEIEAAIGSVSGIDEVAVTYQQLEQGFGYITAHIGTQQKLEANHLRVECQKLLPDYMIPHKFIFFTELPKNQNGKIDKTTLRVSS